MITDTASVELGDDLTIHTILPDDFTPEPTSDPSETTTPTNPGGGGGNDDGLLIAVIILAVLLCLGVAGVIGYVIYFKKK